MIRLTSAKSGEYLWLARKCLAQGDSGVRAIKDGLYTVVCKWADEVATLFTLGGGSFLCTPRRLGANDGYTEELEEQGIGTIDYPLSEASNTTATLILEADDNRFERDVQLYGNIDWTYVADDPADAIVLTWSGAPTRSFAVDPYTPTSDIMQFDEEITTYIGGLPLPTPVFTCFTPNIYSQGAILATIPNGGAKTLVADVKTTSGYTSAKVLGCAYQKGALIAIVGMNYRDMENPDGGTGGFFNEVYVLDDGWTRIAHAVASRHTVNWFFNQSGTQASTIHENTIWTVDIASDTAGGVTTYSAIFTKDAKPCTGTFTRSKTRYSTSTGVLGGIVFETPFGGAYDDYSGDLVLTGTGGGEIKVTRNMTCKVAVDYVGDLRTFATITRKDEEIENNDQVGESEYALLPVIPDSVPGTILAVSWLGDANGLVVGGCFGASVTGGTWTCEATWTATGGVTVDERSGCITAIECVAGDKGYSTITATNKFGSASITKAFRYGVSLIPVHIAGIARRFDCSTASMTNAVTATEITGAGRIVTITATVANDPTTNQYTKCNCPEYTYDECIVPALGTTRIAVQITTSEYICA